jgi:hypothetical protein
MAQKKNDRRRVKLQVIADAVQDDGETYPNGAQFTVTAARAKELLATGTVIKA